MNEFEKYRLAWKNEEAFERQTFAEPQVRHFMHAQSQGMEQGYRRALLFDMALKALLFISLVPLIFWFDSSLVNGWCLILFAILAYGMYSQYRSYELITNEPGIEGTALDWLESQMRYYHRYFHRSILVSALSSAIVYLSGSFYYYRWKYQGLPDFALDDVVVLAVGALLAFGVSAFAQITQGDHQIGQLQNALTELMDGVDTQNVITRFKQSKARSTLIISLLLSAGVGLLFLLYLIYVRMH